MINSCVGKILHCFVAVQRLVIDKKNTSLFVSSRCGGLTVETTCGVKLSMSGVMIVT
jgi:hypothetical protein